MSAWHVEGQYFETCNCDFVCPCITSNLTAAPSRGGCIAAAAMRIDAGEKDGVRLDGMKFMLVLSSPGAMADGDMSIGVVVDDRATPDQYEAIVAIATGAAGGPMARLAPLVAHMAGVERRSIDFRLDGLSRHARAGELLELACEGMPSAVREGEAIEIENTAHPVNRRLALAKATRSHFDAFGVVWDDEAGRRNAHFAPFAWHG